jgi:large subunit ribosomal protein L35
MLPFRACSAITPAFRRPAKGLPWRRCCARHNRSIVSIARRTGAFAACRSKPQKESQMPKLKTKSGAKKRFKITGAGKVMYAQKGKRHGMIKRTKKQIRQLRGTEVMFKTDGDRIKKFFLPNG